MARKQFFRDRSVRQIRALTPRRHWSLRTLLERVLDLAPDEALELRVDLHPPGITYDPPDLVPGRTGIERSRMLRKRGETLRLAQHTLAAMRAQPRSIMDDLLAALDHLGRPGEARGIGYRFKPVWGPDRVSRYVFWDDLADGQRLARYAATTAPISFLADYTLPDGIMVSCTVPSMERKRPRYRYALSSLPHGRDAAVIARSIRASLVPEASRPTIAQYRDLRGRAPGNESLHRIILLEQDVAAYAAYTLARNDDTLFTYRPFAYFSAPLQRLDERLRNNILIYDASLTARDNPDRLRKLHEEERARVLGWGVAFFREEAFLHSSDALRREIFKPVLP